MHSQRKLDHLRACLDEDVAFRHRTTGLERYGLIHQALPELALEEIDTSCHFLNRHLEAPLLVSAMTGGTLAAEALNRNLALAAQTARIAIAVGSQRAALTDDRLAMTYAVRDIAPDVLLFANLGAVQLNYGYGIDECEQVVAMLEADALILHINPLQECLQQGGNTNFSGLLGKIKQICRELSVPVIVKEVGWGLSGKAAIDLVQAGVSVIDVAGAGGTCWARVEKFRADEDRLKHLAETFEDWGISTADSIRWVRENAPHMPIIASGGIRNGIDIIKSLCLGADIAGMALPFLEPATISSNQVLSLIEEIVLEMKIAMLCLDTQNLQQLNESQLYPL